MESKTFEAPLDPFSEYAMAVESDDYPKTDFTQLGFTGRIDFPALSEAFDEALKLCPMFSCHLFEKRQGAFFQPYWKFDNEVPNRLQFVDCRPMVKEPFDPMEFSTDFYAGKVRRRLDLSREFPFNCFLLRVGDEKYIFSICYHHSSMDPNKAYNVLTHMLAGYHERVAGQKPDWADSLGMAALKREGGLVKPIPFGKFAKEQLSDLWLENRASLMSHLYCQEVRDYRKVKGRHSLRAVIEDRDLIRGLFNRVKRHPGATLNDLFFASMRLTLSNWNREHDTDSERFRILLITSLKGRTELPEWAGAGLSGLNFVSKGHGNADFDTLIKWFRDIRVHQLANGYDIQAHALTCKIINGMRAVAPMKVRRAMMKPLLSSAPATYYISNLGVVWPKWVDGKPTADSAIVKVGDFEIDDIHSSASMARTLELGLTTRSHNRRMYFNFVMDRFRFRFHEAAELRDRVMKDIKDTAD